MSTCIRTWLGPASDNLSLCGALAGVLAELEGVLNGDAFGSVLNLDTLKMNLASDVMIPGVAVASSRATPLAGEHSLILQLIRVGFNPYLWRK